MPCHQAITLTLASSASLMDCVAPAYHRRPGKTWDDVLAAMVYAIPAVYGTMTVAKSCKLVRVCSSLQLCHDLAPQLCQC